MPYKKLTALALFITTLIITQKPALALTTTPSEALPLIRLYNAGLQDHFYTTSRKEADTATTFGYKIEGELGTLNSLQTSETNPIYRLYNQNSKKHFYTTSDQEAKNVTINAGYKLEGIIGFLSKSSSPQISSQVYRLYHTKINDHFYTTNSLERDAAVRSGYTSEGTLDGYLSNNSEIVTQTPPPVTPPVSNNTCTVFPNDNPWNTDISKYPTHSNSTTYISSIGGAKTLHPDFGETQSYGIPYVVVDKNQTKVPIHFTAYGDESDPGPYPIPSSAPVEGGSDRHVIVLDKDNCILYELFNASKNSDNSWNADAGSIFNLKSNDLRPAYWTSADAAGLPIYPGLVKYEEVASGSVNHAIRFTTPKTQKGFIHPATHFAGSSDTSLPPMGLRVRLKADYDISKLPYQAKVIAEAMKKYGMILADNGSAWFFSGSYHSSWDDDQLNTLKTIPGNAFEAIDTGPIIK